MVCTAIDRLIAYGIEQNLCAASDAYYVRHRLMNLLQLDDWVEPETHVIPPAFGHVQALLDELLDFALSQGVLPNDGITQKDLLDTAIMDCLLPPPSVAQKQFAEQLAVSAVVATDTYYHQSRASNYVRVARIAKNLTWVYRSPFGDLDVTVNLSKPEFDPKAIIAAGATKSEKYPLCLLCRENEGYAGRVDHPARQNLRLMPLTLQNESWFLQYSPYEYYTEHCIVLKSAHEPMSISGKTFARLLDFVRQFPHYFVGSNADLPIVGGSILSHDHFQGGRYEFAMANAQVIHSQASNQYPDVTMELLHWPLSVVRLVSGNESGLLAVAENILKHWRAYSDESVDVFAWSGETPHNTITPIARHRHGLFELDLVLRNNRTSAAHPLGIFHPHAELHHIKKENIGLIEVMGLAVLPERLATAMKVLGACLLGEATLSDYPELAAHQVWFDSVLPEYDQSMPVDEFLQMQVGRVFEQVLTHAGVFKQTDTGIAAFKRFLNLDM